MNTLQCPAIITGVRSKVDRSLGLTLGTPELSPEEKAQFMMLQGVNLLCIFKPLDEINAPVYKIDKELESKTPGQRLRAVLYVLWEQEGLQGEFKDFYREKMERIITKVKDMLE